MLLDINAYVGHWPFKQLQSLREDEADENIKEMLMSGNAARILGL